jgi:hypothetical protein
MRTVDECSADARWTVASPDGIVAGTATRFGGRRTETLAGADWLRPRHAQVFQYAKSLVADMAVRFPGE